MRLSRHRYLTGDTDGAEAAGEEALRTVTPLRTVDAAVRRSPSAQPPDAAEVGDRCDGGSGVAAAATNRGTLLALGGHPGAGAALREAHVLAHRAGRFDLVRCA